MKVKLKKGEKLSSNNNYCNLKYEDWVSLNQGKSVSLDKLTKEIEDKVEVIKDSKKGVE